MYSEVDRGLTLVRAYAPTFGLMTYGYDQWIQHKSEEDYSVLYRDKNPKDRVFVAWEQAIQAESKVWATRMCSTQCQFARLRLKNQRSDFHVTVATQLPAYTDHEFGDV